MSTYKISRDALKRRAYKEGVRLGDEQEPVPVRPEVMRPVIEKILKKL